MIDHKRVLEVLPHRYPFLMVDKVVELVKGERAVGIKNVTFNEPYFAGHFPDNPVMPGVMQGEALAQTAAVLGMETAPEYIEDGGVLLMGLDKVRFRRLVVPGDTLRMEVQLLKKRRNIWRIKGVATVDGEKAAEAEILAMFTLEEK